MTLFVNTCVRKDSRTKRLADHLLSKIDDDIEEVRLEEIVFPVADEMFLEKRDAMISEGRFDDPLFHLARRFASAERIVIAAPYWDLSFPASLKQYIEQINVIGVTFAYTEDGRPKGLCRARELYYIASAGGPFVDEAFGFGYIKALAETYYGIGDVRKIIVSGLDVIGADEEKKIREGMDMIDERYK